MILLKDIVEANANLMMADLEGEAVLLNIQTGRYFGLNEVGTSIWALIKKPCAVSDVIEGLQREYDVEEGVLNNDVLAFLEDMEKRNLVHVLIPFNVTPNRVIPVTV